MIVNNISVKFKIITLIVVIIIFISYLYIFNLYKTRKYIEYNSKIENTEKNISKPLLNVHKLAEESKSIIINLRNKNSSGDIGYSFSIMRNNVEQLIDDVNKLPNNIETLKITLNELLSLQASIPLLEKLSKESYDISYSMDRATSIITYKLETIENTLDKIKTNPELYVMLTSTINHINNLVYLDNLKDLNIKNYKIAKLILEIENLIKNPLEKEALDSLKSIFAGPNSLMQEKRTQININNNIEAHQNKILALLQTILKQTQEQIFTLHSNILTDSVTQKTIGISSQSKLMIISTLSIIFIILLTWLFLVKSIMHRLLNTSEVMNSIANGNVESIIPTIEKDEIGDMLSALSKLRDYVVKVSELVLNDFLTNLHNRRYFDKVLETEIRRCKRNIQPLSLILCDIDDFKSYNDGYGHILGDSCLTEVAKAINESFARATDHSCRYGGEEFAIILTETNTENAITLAEKLRIAVEALSIPHNFSLSDTKIVTLSIGVTTLLPNEEIDVEKLIERADRALYAAKKNGKNCVKFIEE